MSALDTIAGVGVGCYLIAVGVNGNAPALLEQAKKDRAFLPWAISVAVVVYLYKIPNMATPVTIIIIAAFLGLFLKNGNKIVQNGTQFWDSLSGAYNG